MNATHETRRLTRTDFGVALCLAAILLIGGGAVMTPGVTGVFHDDAVYVSTAKALADGQGYHLIHLPGSPRQTKYPILYPAVLAVIWKAYSAFPDNVAVMQWFTLLCGATATALAYLYIVAFAYAGRVAAGAAAALAATTPFLAHLYGLTLSEAMFSTLVVMALWRLDWQLAQLSLTRGQTLLTGALLALPFLCRTPGIVTIVVGLAVLIWRRLPVGGVLAGTAVVSAPWLVWSIGGMGAWQANPISGYYTDYAGAWTALALPMTGQIAAWNSFALAHATVGLPLEGALAWARGWRGVVPLALGLGAAVWVSVLWSARTGRLLALFLTLYAALLLAWPWPPARFLVPVLPLLLGVALGWLGASVRGRLPAYVQRLALTVGLSVLLIPNALLLARRSTLNHAFGYPYYTRPSEPAEWRAYGEVFDWVRRNTDETAVLASPLDSMVSLYTGRKAFRPFAHRPGRLFYGEPGPPLGTARDLITSLVDQGSDYLVVMPMFDFSEAKAFQEVVRLCAEEQLIRLVYEGRDRRFQVFRRAAPAHGQ